MSSTLQRDQASALAKTSPKKALEKAKSVSEPWFRAQALSWVARFTDGDPVTIAKQAAKAATACDDDYKRSAVRAWEIAALAERGCFSKAKESLEDAIRIARSIQPISSRSEALFHLFQAAYAISPEQAACVKAVLEATCPENEHWRCKRNRRDAGKTMNGELEPRKFFW